MLESVGILFSGLVFVVASVWMAWRQSRRIQNRELRVLVKAGIVTFLLTPTVVDAPSCHGAAPAPAWVAMIMGIAQPNLITLLSGAVPFLVAWFVVWLVSLIIDDKKKKHKDESRA